MADRTKTDSDKDFFDSQSLEIPSDYISGAIGGAVIQPVHSQPSDDKGDVFEPWLKSKPQVYYSPLPSSSREINTSAFDENDKNIGGSLHEDNKSTSIETVESDECIETTEDTFDEDIAESVWKAVKAYYERDFHDKWVCRLQKYNKKRKKGLSVNKDNNLPTVKEKEADKDTNKGEEKPKDNNKCSSTVRVIAALVVEKHYKQKNKVFEVGAVGLGTKHEDECSLKSNTDVWMTCDGHAEAVCFQYTNEYLLNEMYKRCLGMQDSLFNLTSNGFDVKENIRFHLFVSHPPCGFMTDTDLYFVSWKQFKNKPHCLQCSSKILINSFLGIQGYLSHLLVKPIYISHIVFPLNDNFDSLIRYMKDLKFQPKQINCYSFNKPTIVPLKSKIQLENYKPLTRERKHIHQQATNETSIEQDAITPSSSRSPQASNSITNNEDEAKDEHTATSEGTNASDGKGTSQICGAVPGFFSEIINSCNVYSLTQNEKRLEDENIKKVNDMILEIQNKLKLTSSIIESRLDSLKNAQAEIYQYIKVSFVEQCSTCKEKFQRALKEGKEAMEKVVQDINKNSSKLGTVTELLEQVKTTTKKLTDTQKKLENNLKYEEMYNLLVSQNVSSINCDCDWIRYERMIEQNKT